MKKQITKSLVAFSMTMAMLFGGSVVFASGTSGKLKASRPPRASEDRARNRQ